MLLLSRESHNNSRSQLLQTHHQAFRLCCSLVFCAYCLIAYPFRLSCFMGAAANQRPESLGLKWLTWGREQLSIRVAFVVAGFHGFLPLWCWPHRYGCLWWFCTGVTYNSRQSAVVCLRPQIAREKVCVTRPLQCLHLQKSSKLTVYETSPNYLLQKDSWGSLFQSRARDMYCKTIQMPHQGNPFKKAFPRPKTPTLFWSAPLSCTYVA